MIGHRGSIENHCLRSNNHALWMAETNLIARATRYRPRYFERPLLVQFNYTIRPYQLIHYTGESM